MPVRFSSAACRRLRLRARSARIIAMSSGVCSRSDARSGPSATATFAAGRGAVASTSASMPATSFAVAARPYRSSVLSPSTHPASRWVSWAGRGDWMPAPTGMESGTTSAWCLAVCS